MSVLTSTKKRFALIAFILSLPILLLSNAFAPGKGDDGLKIGKKMPLSEREMEGTDGKLHSLNSLMKPNGILVVFSCNTCPFVVGNDDFEGWENQYNDLHKRAEAANIGMVLVNSNEAKRDNDDSMNEMISHAKQANYSMPYVVDKQSELADALGAKTTPHVYAFNAEKKLIFKGSIDNIWDSKRAKTDHYAHAVIDHLSKGSQLKETSTPPRGCSIKRVKK